MGFQGLAIEVGRPITLIRPSSGFAGLSVEVGALRTFIRPVNGFSGISVEKPENLGIVRTTIIKTT